MRNRTRKQLFLTTSISRCTPLRREGEGEQGGGTGGDSGGGGDNKGGNSDSGGGGGDPNAGQQFDYSSFWAAKEPEGDSNDSGNEGDAGKELGTRLVGQIQNFKPDDVFTAATLEKMANGDLTDLNSGLQKSFQAGLTQMLGITAELMKAFEGNFDKRIESLINGKIEGSRTSQNDEKLLGDTFKGFANQAMRPMIQGVFNKALEHSKGDRPKALDLAKGMLQAMGQHGKDDFGFSRFTNPDNNLDEGPSRLVQELLELKG